MGTLLFFFTPPTACAQVTMDVVRGDLREEKFVDAEHHARDLLAATERLHGADSRQVADVLDLLAEAMRKAGNTREPEAVRVCQRSLEIKERLSPTDDPSIAVSLENLGALYLANRDLEKARSPLERALGIRSRALGPDHPDVAWSLIWLAHLEELSARVDSAYVLARRAVAIQDATHREDDLRRVKGLDMLAAVQYQRGEYQDAASLYERALGFHLASRGQNSPSTASALHNLGVCFSEMGDYGEARSYLERARRIQRRVLPQPNAQTVRTLQSLGLVREKQGDVAGALSLFREAYRAAKETFGPDDAEVGWCLMYVGRLELKQGRRLDARKRLAEALRIQEKALGPAHPDLAWTLRALAQSDARSGRVDSALARGMRAVAIEEQTLGPSHPDLAPSLADVAEYSAMSGDTTAAFELALRSIQIRTDHLRLSAGGLSERQALAYAAVGPTGLDVALALLAASRGGRAAGMVRRVWEALAQTRTLVLDEMAERHRASVEDTPGNPTSTKAFALAEARRRLANLLVRGPTRESPERYQTLLRTARLEMERAERDLGGVRFEARTSQSAPPNLDEIFNALPPQTALVAYASYVVRGARRYMAFVKADSLEPISVPIGDAVLIDGLVRRWVEKVGTAPPEGAELARAAEGAGRLAGRSLKSAVWDPVRPLLGGVTGVILVPDGTLHGVNFDALPMSDSGYLVEEGRVLHYLTSEIDIATTRTRRTHGEGLLALGGVDFGSAPKAEKARSANGDGGASDGDDCSTFYDVTFTPLPESRREVDEIGSAWGSSSNTLVLSGDQATEAAFKRLAPGRRVLHLATHGFYVNPTRCLQELAGARGIAGLEFGVRPKARPAFEQQSPLLLSGLALADANRRSEATPHDEDGILTAEEVASLDLRGVEWAVLSACDTGVAGASSGEGVLGLRRAFRTAGVATLVISLWPVQDQAAREWMRSLYQHRFHDGADTAHAARAAMLDVLRSRRAQSRSTNPFYWASFVATGDWN